MRTFHEKAISHTTMLIKAVAICSETTIPETTMVIGKDKIARLLHNSPMNQLLDFSRVVREVIHDCDIRECTTNNIAEPDVAYGAYAASIVMARTANHQEFVDVLYSLLIGS